MSGEKAGKMWEAYEQSLGEDRILLEQIGENRKNRRRRDLLVSIFMVLGVLSLLSVSFLAMGERPGGEPSLQPGAVLPTSDQELDTLISALEDRLRKPGSEEDYRFLSRAYRARYERAGDPEDFRRSLAAAEREWKLKRKKEGVMQRSPLLFIGILLISTAALIGLTAMFLYNSLVSRDETVDARWSQVETVLQRRLDVIPNVVEAVKGYAAHEAQTLTAVTEARGRMLGALGGLGGKAPAAASAAPVHAAQQALGSALGRLLALVESYPDLKASRNFHSLQDQLEGTENRIAVERMRYNESVRDYNARLRLFPYNLIGSLFGFAPRAYFESERGAEQAVDIRF